MTDQCDHGGCTSRDRDDVPRNHRPWVGMRADQLADHRRAADMLADATRAEDAAVRRADATWRPAGPPVRSHAGTVYRRNDRRLRRSKAMLVTGLILLFGAIFVGVIGGIVAGVQLVWWAP